MSRYGVWFGAGLLLFGCGGRARGGGEDGIVTGGGGMSGGGTTSTAGSVTGGSAQAGTTSMAGSTVGAPDLKPLHPRDGALPVEGDGRLPDVPETGVGGQVIGWDLCVGNEEVASSRTECEGCAASRGSDFLVVNASLQVDIDSLKPQLYFYFFPPQGAQSLWFDVTLLDGIAYAELSLWETDSYCKPVSEQRLFDLSLLLQSGPGTWSSACVPLDEARLLQGIGLRVSAAGRVGLDALRFGGACLGE